MRKLMLTAVVAIFACTIQVRADQATLALDGISSDDDAKVVAGALGKIESVKVTTTPTKDKPVAVVTFDASKTNIGDLAKVVAAAETSGRDKTKPAATLVVKYMRLDGSAAPDETFMPQRFLNGVAKLKGVDAKKSRLDIKNQQFHLRLDEQGGANLADIKKGFPGIQVE
jgi:hypothetical protein